MSVSGVNQAVFSGNVATTKNGNEYKKTNAGKTTMAVVTGLETGYLAYSFNKQEGGIKGVFERMKNVVMKEYPEVKNVKGVAIAGAVALAAIGIALNIGVGAIMDSSANKASAKNADEEAKPKIDAQA